MTEALLKPCPFCGSHDVKSGGDDKVVGSWCQNCGAQGPNGYQSELDWNHRHIETELIEALKGILTECAPEDPENWGQDAIDAWRNAEQLIKKAEGK